MSKEAMKLALEALEDVQYYGWGQTERDYDARTAAITALREALAEQPAQRTWVRLTNNELQPIANEYRILFGSWVEDFARAIEAKLKEKNNG
jgi:hypothetical protein